MEKWKSVAGYEGLYEVSNMGRVKSLKKDLILKPHANSRGYINQGLYKDGKYEFIGVHRLVAKAFIENPNDYNEVNHIDENPSNNNANNLEWCNHDYNIHFGTALSRMRKSVISNFTPFICEETGVIWKSQAECAKKMGIDRTNLGRHLNGKKSHISGLHFHYLDSAERGERVNHDKRDNGLL